MRRPRLVLVLSLVFTRPLHKGTPLSKYVKKVQYYFDNHLLEPNNAILGTCATPGSRVREVPAFWQRPCFTSFFLPSLDEAHKNFVLDKVVGMGEEAGGNGGPLCLLRHIMQKPCQTVEQWSEIDTLISSFMDLLILWIPLHRSTLLYAFFNELLYRNYGYYKNATAAVIEHVNVTYGAHLDRSTVARHSPGELLLVHHIVQFRRKGGFEVIMHTVSDSKPIGIRFFKNIIRFLWMIKPFYDEQIKTEILPRVPEAAFRSQLLNFDTKSLREVNSTDMEAIFEQMRLILKDTCDVEQVLLEHGFAFAIKCLEADILTKRILGLEWVKTQLQVTYAAMPEMRAALKARILESPFFEKLFNHSVMKKQLVDSSAPLLVWLLSEHALTDAHLDSIFRSIGENQLTDSDVCDGFFDLLVSLIVSPNATPNLVGMVWQRLVAFPAAAWTPRAVRLVGFIARSAIAPVYAVAAVDWLWAALDSSPKGVQISAECRAEAVSQLPHIAGAVAAKEDYLRERFVADGRLVHLRLLVRHVADNESARRTVSASELFENLFEPIVKSFALYRSLVVERRAILKNQHLGNMNDLVVDVFKHLDEIKSRLDMLSTLAREGNVIVSKQRVVQLWQAVMNEGDQGVAREYEFSQEERDVCLDGLYKFAADAHQKTEDGSFPLELLLQLLEAHPEYASQTSAGFRAFREIFESVNGTLCACDFVSGPGQSGGLRPVLKSMDVRGMPVVWGIAISSSSSVAKDTAEFLLMLYLAPGPQLEQQTEAVRRQFCAEAMSRLGQLVGAKADSVAQATRVLGLLKSAIEMSTKAEDLAKKRDAGSAGAAVAGPPEKPLKDAPAPRYSDQKDYVQKAIDSGMLPDYIPEDLRFVVVSLLFDKFGWMRFDYWAGDMYENQDLVLNMIEKAREYKRILPAGASDSNKNAANANFASCGTILATADASYWETFFRLLEANSASTAFCQLGWEVMSLLDADKTLYDKIVAATDPARVAPVDWNALLGSQPNYKLLHSLQMLERSFIPSRDEGQEEHARKTVWCKKFLRVGGFRYLLALLHGLALQRDIHSASVSTQCLVRILEVVYRFMRAPLSAADFAPELETRSPLELSVSSENLMFAGPTVLDIPDVMFQLVHAHAMSEHSTSDDQKQQQQVGAVGNYALYLLVACVLKVPSVWSSFRDALSPATVLDVLTSKNTQFSAAVAERLFHLCRMFVGAAEDTPQQYFLRMLLQSYSAVFSKRRHDCRSVFAFLCNLVRASESAPDKEQIKALFSEILLLPPKDDAADPDEYLAGLMSFCAELMKKAAGSGAAATGSEERLFTTLLDTYLYAPLTSDGMPSALAKSAHLRQACFNLIGALVSSGALGADGVERGLNALGGQYMESPVVREWKEGAVGAVADDEDVMDRAVKTSKFMGLRNLACTCYMNATVQHLFNVSPFVNAILRAPTPVKDVKAESGEASKREDRLRGLTALSNVLRRVVADPVDEMIRLLHSESDEYKALVGVVHKDKTAVEFLKSLGWQDDGTGSLMLPSTVVLDDWQTHLRELNDKCAAEKAEATRIGEQVNPAEMFAQFQRMFAHLSKGGARYFDPKLFVANFPDFDGRPVDVRRQEDAFEFFNRLQYLLEEQLKSSSQAKIFEELFGVREVQVLRCEQHSRPSFPQVAPVIPLEFAPNVMQALDKVYNREGEWISGNFKCEECAKSVRGRKTMALKSTSDYLVIYLKRYDVNMQKVKTTFDIHERLDLSKWSDDYIHETAGSKLVVSEWQYELIGTLNHDGGSMNAGHYFSIIRKEDGSWWRFNDTNVTPFRKSLTEENIGGECVMLFYRRKDLHFKEPSVAVVATNKSLESDVLAENLRLYKLKLLNEKSLFDVLHRLLAARAAQAEGLSAERRLWLAQLAVRFVFETLARFRDMSSTLDSWAQHVLRPLFDGFLPAATWFLKSLLSEERSSWLLEFLLKRDEATLRKVFADLVWSSVKQVFKSEVAAGKFPVPTAGRVAPVYTPLAALAVEEGVPLSAQVIDCLCAMSETSRAYWRNHHEFWDLIANWAELGPLPRRHLAVTQFPVYKVTTYNNYDVPVAASAVKYLTIDFPGLVLDYFLGQFTIVGQNLARSPIGDRTNMSLQRQFDAWALVMTTLSNPAKKVSPDALDMTPDGRSIVDGQLAVAPSGMVHDLLMTKQVASFLSEWIKLGYNSAANNTVMRHWSWESQEASRIFLKNAISSVRGLSGRYHMLRYPVSFLVDAMLIKDSQQSWRASRIFDGTSETPSVFTVFRDDWSYYSKDGAEKAIAILAPFAKALGPEGRKVLSNSCLDSVREYLFREAQPDPTLAADAKLILQAFHQK